ncbi:hypothetical protein HYT23_01455 [Candidatus Pacearchaeota archaeon]|nr:hypothetical protein [Candidatus Pacearchaeota archaeon]
MAPKKGWSDVKPDLVDTLTREDVYQVVLAARNKPYMQKYLSMLAGFKSHGVINREPTLEYVAKRAYELLFFYGMVSKLSRTRPTKGKHILARLEGKEEGQKTTYRLEKYKDYAFVCKIPGSEIIEMVPTGLIRDLRTREIRNLNECGVLESEMTSKTIEDFLG